VKGFVARLPAGTLVEARAGKPRALAAWRGGGRLALNGGFFNHADGVSVSWVAHGGAWVTDPPSNRLLRENEALAPYWGALMARPEWRALRGADGSVSWAIAPHGAPVPGGLRLEEALQAGPRLLPALGLREGAYVRPGADPLGSARRLARSAVGLAPDGGLLLLYTPAASLRGLASALHALGATEALALDGGSSSGMAWPGGGAGQTGAGVASALVVR
jgi:hypothetical protein